MNKDQALKYYYDKYDDPVNLIREFAILKSENGEFVENFFILNDYYLVRVITPEAYNCFMRNQNFRTRISGRKLTKTEFNEICTNKYAGKYTYKLLNTSVNC